MPINTNPPAETGGLALRSLDFPRFHTHVVSVAENGGVAGVLIFRGVARPQYAESAELAGRNLRNCLLVLGGGLVGDGL